MQRKNRTKVVSLRYRVVYNGKERISRTLQSATVHDAIKTQGWLRDRSHCHHRDGVVIMSESLLIPTVQKGIRMAITLPASLLISKTNIITSTNTLDITKGAHGNNVKEDWWCYWTLFSALLHAPFYLMTNALLSHIRTVSRVFSLFLICCWKWIFYLDKFTWQEPSDALTTIQSGGINPSAGSLPFRFLTVIYDRFSRAGLCSRTGGGSACLPATRRWCAERRGNREQEHRKTIF